MSYNTFGVQTRASNWVHVTNGEHMITAVIILSMVRWCTLAITRFRKAGEVLLIEEQSMQLYHNSCVEF